MEVGLLAAIVLMITSLFLVYFIKKFSLIGLIILTCPMSRFYIDVGFAIKPIMVVLALAIFFKMINSVISGEHFTFAPGNIIRRNNAFILQFLFILSFGFSEIINGFNVVSLRVSLLLVFVVIGALFLYDQIKNRDCLELAINTFLWTGLILGVSGLLFYAIYHHLPVLMTKCHFFFVHGQESLFRGVYDDPKRPWIPAGLFSVAISAPEYAFSLLPFISLSIAFFLSSKNRRKRIQASILTGVLLLNLYLTFNRTAMIGLFVSLVVFGWFILQKAKGHKIMYIILSLVFILLLKGVLLNAFYAVSETKGFISIRYNDFSYLTAKRSPYWILGLETFLQNPFFGIGDKEFQYLSEAFFGDRKQAHNIFIDLLAEHGIFCTCLFTLVFYKVIKKGSIILKRFNRNDPLYIYLACSLSGFTGMIVCLLAQSILVSFILWIFIALILSFEKIIGDKNINIKEITI